MKLISLNCWQNKLSSDLFPFLKKEMLMNTDIFLFQESDLKSVQTFKKILHNHNCVFFEKDYINTWKFEQSTFFDKKIQILNKSYNSKTNKIGGILLTKLKTNDKEFVVINIHGAAMPGDKKDNKDRIKQTKDILEICKEFKLPTIIGGDFNLNPDTKSVSLFEEYGFKNLIKEFKIKKTRSRHAWEQAERQKDELGLQFFGKQYFADYCFVSNDVKVKSFTVPDIEISDHLPLILEFEI